LIAFERSIALQADFDLAWYGKGLALLQTRSYHEALTAMEQALAVNPQNGLAWFRKAEILLTLGRHDEAYAAYEMVQQHADSPSLRAEAEKYLHLLREHQ
jgi:tetratricopeptide (TPR) repeat protein